MVPTVIDGRSGRDWVGEERRDNMGKRVVLLSVASALLAGAPAMATELVSNGGFETGDFTGWTQFGDPSYTGVDNGGSFPAHGGSFTGYFGPITAGGIQQALTANIGDVVTVSFYYAQAFGSPGESMTVTLGSVPVFSAADFTNTAYTQFTGNFTVADTNPMLTFTFVDPPDYVLVDDVSVSPAPAPGALALAGIASLTLRRRRR
jgi:MYXO-CTERM domain-containing protein